MQSMVQHAFRARRRPRLGALRGLVAAGAIALGLAAVTPQPAAAQWVTTYDQFYYPAEHNWVYRDKYPFADRLFNAFDYGHSILYEELYTKPDAPPSRLEEKQYDFLTKRVLPNPPRVPLEEVAIEIQYSRLAPEAKLMFEWAHVLHRQAYDVLADERLSEAEKDREMAKLLAYYKSRRDVKFSSLPKSMKLMQEQRYSLAFRKGYPKFNGLIWGYHWLQVGLYEPLVVGKTFAERQALSTAAVGRFRQMLQNPPRTMPYQMPMTAAVAPEFAKRYPEQAIIFDNLHSMHDVVSDILANDSVPRDRKRAEIVRAGRLFRDDSSYLIASTEAWRTMSREMGQENMGGPAVGFTTALPTPTVTYGAVMSHNDSTGQMVAMKYGQMTGAHGGTNIGGASMPGMRHGGTAGTPSTNTRGDSARVMRDTTGGVASVNHSRMNTPGAPAAVRSPAGQQTMDHATMGHAAVAATPAASGMTEMHMRMMADPVIRRRMMADTAMRRMMTEMMRSMPADRRAQMEAMMRDSASQAASPSTARRRPTARPPTKAPARPAPRARPAPQPADPHAGHTMPPARPAAPPAPQPPMDHSKMGKP